MFTLGMTVFRLKLNEQRKVERGKVKLHSHDVFQKKFRFVPAFENYFRAFI